MSETVKRQIKENRVRLEQEKVRVVGGTRVTRVVTGVEREEVREEKEEVEEVGVAEDSCCKALC